MNDNYWSDYTYFLNKVQALWQQTPANLLEFYTKLIVALENKTETNFILFELEYEFNYRMIIQEIINYPDLKNNRLKDDFEVTVSELDKRIIPFLTYDCAIKTDWYKNIDLKSSTT